MSPVIHYVVLALLTAGVVLFSVRTLRGAVGRAGTVRILIGLGVYAAFSLGFVFALSLSGKGPVTVLARTVGVLVTTAVAVFALVGVEFAALSAGKRLFKNTRESWKVDAIASLVASAVIFIAAFALISRISS